MQVTIIGAGIAGLYTAYILDKSGIDVRVLEASDRVGGRIYSYEGFERSKVEFGAEQIHGRRSSLFEMLEHLSEGLGGKIIPESGDYYYHYQQQLYEEQDILGIKEVKKVLDFFDEGIEHYEGQEQSLNTYLRNKPYYNPHLQNMIEGLASEYGTSAGKLSLGSLAKEEKQWSSGERNYYWTLPMSDACEYLASELKDKILLNRKVIGINYASNPVEVMDVDGVVYPADKVVVTVPLGVLKANDIQFFPYMPEDKVEAINSIGFDKGMKIFLQFSERWWDEDMLEIIGGNLSPVYMTNHPNYKSPILMAYVMGDKADFLSGESPERLKTLLTAELDKIFKHTKASETITNIVFKDWGEEKYCKGAYSFATASSSGMREILAEPIQDKIFFAGEACNIQGHASTVHGAMETAEAVANHFVSV